MRVGGFRRRGWVWTREGWKKTPRPLRQAKAVSKPTRRKRRRIRRISRAAPKAATPLEAEASQVLKERGRADSARTPAPKAATPARRSPRRAWSGKYDDLTKPTKEEP